MRTRNTRWPYSLRGLELFSDCSDAELEQIAPLLTEVQVDEGRVILHQGSRDRQFMVISEGHAVVTFGTDRRWLAEVGPGSFVGELSLLDDRPRSATVTAATTLGLYACNEREFDALLASAPSVHAKINSAATERRQGSAAAA